MGEGGGGGGEVQLRAAEALTSSVYIHTYTLFGHGKNTSYRIKILKVKLIYMFAV